MEMWYRIITTGGIIPVIWSLATGWRTTTMLVAFDQEIFLRNFNSENFQMMFAT